MKKLVFSSMLVLFFVNHFSQVSEERRNSQPIQIMNNNSNFVRSVTSNNSVTINPFDLFERYYWANNNYPTVKNGYYGFCNSMFTDTNVMIEYYGPTYSKPWIFGAAQSFDLKGVYCKANNAPYDSVVNPFFKDVYYTISKINVNYYYHRYDNSVTDTAIISVYAKNNGNLDRYSNAGTYYEKSVLNYRDSLNSSPDSAIGVYKVLLSSSLNNNLLQTMSVSTNIDVYNSEGEFAVSIDYKSGRSTSYLADTIGINTNSFHVEFSNPNGAGNSFQLYVPDKTIGSFNTKYSKYGSFNYYLNSLNYTSHNYQLWGISVEIDEQNSIVCDTIYDTVNMACSNQSFIVWNDSNYSISGNYEYLDTFGNFGCDTIHYLDLTFSHNSFDTVIVQGCNLFVKPSGDTLHASGIYNDTIPNSQGCDSIIQINLTITSNYITVTKNYTKCDSVFIPAIGMIYNTGVYKDTVVNLTTCDSITEYTVLINQTSLDTVAITACDSYVFPSGRTESITGVYYDTLTNVTNCDSIIQINLTINNTTYSALSLSNCFSYLMPSGILVDTSGVYLDTIMNMAGCDSVITFTIQITKINDSVYTTNDTIFSLENGGNVYNWLSCDNGFASAIGITSSTSFAASGRGNYAVEITKNGCVDTTNCGTVKKCSQSIFQNYKSDGSTDFSLYSIDSNSISYIDWVINGVIVRKDSTETFNTFINDGGYLVIANVKYKDSIGCQELFWTSINHPNSTACTYGIDTLGYDTAGNMIVKIYLNKVSPFDEILFWELGDSFSAATQVYQNQDTIIDTLIYHTTKVRYRTKNTMSNSGCWGFFSLYGNPTLSCKSDFEIIQVAPYHLTILDKSFGDDFLWKYWDYGDGFADSNYFVISSGIPSQTYFPSHVYTTTGKYNLCMVVIGTDTTGGVWTDVCISNYCDSINIDTNGINRSIFTINVVPYSSYYNNDTNYISSCQGYQSPGGTKIFNTSGVFLDTLTNIYNTDSIIILKLELTPSSYFLLKDTFCDTYLTSGGMLIHNAGIYYDTLVSAVGCDSIVTMELAKYNDNQVSVFSGVLTSNATGVSYQWLDCDSGYAVISGATSQSFSPFGSGNYAVELIGNGCTDTSSCVSFGISSLGTISSLKNGIKLYPNPSQDYFILTFSERFKKIQISIFDINGKLVKVAEKYSNERIEVMHNLDPGVYIVNVNEGKSNKVFKLVVE